MFTTLSKIFSALIVIACLSFAGYLFSLNIGLLPEKIPISGTGSMYPTFPKGNATQTAELANQVVATPAMNRFPGGINLGNIHLFSYQLQRFDIVSFENDRTRKVSEQDTGQSSGFVKRVVGLPGETLEIRDGFVWINGQRLVEGFTSTPRSTFGGASISDCQKLTIPEGYIFVLGDNRKASNDSRHDIGLVSVNDIDHVLPYKNQSDFDDQWRDATNDYLLANHPLLDTDEYLRLLNEKRKEFGLSQLKHQSKLDNSAKKRAAVMLKYNDLSFEATKSGMTMEKSMAEVGYSNITWGEAPTIGYYNAEELVENFFQFPQSRDFLLTKDFQETGISAQVGEINGCPVQIVVQHLAGYIPPNYKSEVVNSWVKALSQLREVLPSWEKVKDNPQLYNLNTEEIAEVVSLMKQRISHLEAIVSRMQANQWLTLQEKTWYDQDESLAKKLETLTNKINNSGN